MSKTPKCFFPNTPSSSTLQVITSFLSVLFLHCSLDNARYICFHLFALELSASLYCSCYSFRQQIDYHFFFKIQSILLNWNI